MTISLSKILLLSGFVAMTSLASATPVNIDCAGPGGSQINVPDVTALAPDTCSVIGSGLIFSTFGVTSTSGTAPTIGIGSPDDGTGVAGSDTDIVFSVSGGIGLDDTFLTYEVTGGLLGLDMSFEAAAASSSASVTITEIACSVAFVSDACPGKTYADFSATSTCAVFICDDASNLALLVGGPESVVYIQKDIAFNNANLSDFENSHIAAVPEPAATALIGAGLLGIGFLRRRYPAAKC
jgi:hypothetical protein